MPKTSYSAERDMEERVKRIDDEVNRIDKRESQKSQLINFPLEIWLDSGFEEGGILIIHDNPNIRMNLYNTLRNRGHKVQMAIGDNEIQSIIRKSGFSVMIVPWAMFERSKDFVALLRKAFPQTKIIITSPNFAWSSENPTGANHGMEALEAGAYSYVPDAHINESVPICVESSIKSIDRSCPVLLKGYPCNLRCFL